MIAVGIRYLTKYAVATNLARQRPEWPPHPGRLFMALAAAHFETGADPAERTALEWLEAAPAPALRASDAQERSTVRAYVPVNDQLGSKSPPPPGTVPRERAERGFPCVRPDDDCVYMLWSADPAEPTRAALARLCSKVTRLGHSTSAVQTWVLAPGDEPEPNWLPAPGSTDTHLRVTSQGTLHSLEAAFNASPIQQYDSLVAALAAARGRERSRLKQDLQSRFPEGRPESRRPQLARWQGYVRPVEPDSEAAVVDGPFDPDFVVLSKLEGPALGLESTLQLTGALRVAAMKAAGDSVPEWLSGHDASGAPTLLPHVAFFPLPYVGFDYSDGHLLGLGMALPASLRSESSPALEAQLRRCLGPLFFDPQTGEASEIKLWKNDVQGKPVWEWILERETRERPPLTLQRLSWTKPSRIWASVTPVVLHHYPRKRSGDRERIVQEAFISALLPAPTSVTISAVSSVPGAGHAMALPPFTEGGAGLCRFQVHVKAVFDRPVRGPMLVGRGRFRGYGLFRPMPEGMRNNDATDAV